MLSLLLLAVACTGSGGTDTAPTTTGTVTGTGTTTATGTTTGTTAGTTSTPTGPATAPTSDRVAFTIDCAPSPHVATVLRVEWDQSEAGPTRIAFGEGYGRSTATVDAATEGNVLDLVGLRADTEVTFRIGVELDGEEHWSAPATCTTGSLPGGLPALVAGTWDPSRTTADFLLTSSSDTTGENTVVYMVDREGYIVWYFFPEDPTRHTGPVRPRADGTGIWFLEAHPTMDEDLSRLGTISWYGGDATYLDVTWAHHWFDELPDGRLVLLVSDIRTPEGSVAAELQSCGVTGKVAGDAILEMEPDGTGITPVCSTWDHFQPDCENTAEFSPFFGMERVAEDWTHANGVAVNLDRDSYAISMPYLDTIMDCRRSDGSLIGFYGGTEGTYAVDEPFSFQHGPTWTDAGTLMMLSTFSGEDSRVLEYEVDDAAETLSLVWNYDATLSAPVGGGALRLPNGNTLVNFGNSGLLQEVDSAGTVVWELGLADGGLIGLTTPVEGI